MNNWIFQGNPDLFNIDSYLQNNSEIIWSVRQEHYASKMQAGDEVFMWRAAGKSKSKSGIVAYGILLNTPKMMTDDRASKTLWVPGSESENNTALRVPIKILRTCLSKKEVVQRDWLVNDPVVSDMMILKMASQTNYLIAPNEAQRLAALVRNTGRDWNREESLAGLYAFAKTLNKSVSKRPGEPVAEVALTIGRAVGGVYNKVMNFRSIDPKDARKGLSAGSDIDKSVWNEFYDESLMGLDIKSLESEYSRIWGKGAPPIVERKVEYKEFGEAPNDDPNELQLFAARVRKGQPKFRQNLLEAYQGRCAICGHGPEEVLEAVHIVPHASSGINELDNGLLLRADLHTLFDSGLIKINPQSFEVVLAKELAGTPYKIFHGKALSTRVDGCQPCSEYLKQRWKNDF